MRRAGDKPLPALSPAKFDDRGVRTDSVTNQLRALARQKPRRHRAPQLEPLAHGVPPVHGDTSPHNNAPAHERVSVQKQIQGPVSLQWLVDDFVQAAGVGDVATVDHYIRGGIPIDLKHSVLRQTALHASAALTTDAVTRHLVQAGANVNALTKDRESTLHLAARYHSVSVAEEVLRNSADMRVLNVNEKLAKDIAADVQDHELEQLLEPPPKPPSHVHAMTISSTSLTVEWSTNGVTSSAYQFRVSWGLSGSLGEFSEICSSPTFRISNLMPASQYEIHVQTGNHTVGWSENSDLLIVETDGDVPNAMASPLVTRVSDHSIAMRIRLPSNNGADVQRVSIQLQCAGSIAAVTTSTFRKLLKSSDHGQRWESVLCDVPSMRSYEDDPRDKEHCVVGLLPGHVYYFRVKASNRFGWSPDGEVSVGICTNDSPKVVATTPRSMTLVWTKPYSTELIEKYQVQARVSYSTKWETAAADIAEQSAVVGDLIPATAYSFRVVQHYASRGWEDAGSCACTELCTTHTTVPEAPLNLRVVDRTAFSITLSWEMPRCNGHAVESYRLEYRIPTGSEETSVWVTANDEIAVDLKTFCIDDLAPGRGYQFRVGARNALGEGEVMERLHPLVWTYAFLPPTAPECLARTSFSLTIAWQNGASQVNAHAELVVDRQYEVQLCQVDSSLLRALDLLDIVGESGEWRTVVAAQREEEALISGLTPLGCYCFRVRARALSNGAMQDTFSQVGESGADEAGSVFGPISPVFQTLRRM